MSEHIDDHKGVRLESYYVTGGWRQVADHLSRSLASFARSDRQVEGHYIGIASGYDQAGALKERVDERKQSMGITRMVCVYESSSRYNTTNLEVELIRRFKGIKKDPRSLNLAPGGEGRPPGPDKRNYLYFAFSANQPTVVF